MKLKKIALHWQILIGIGVGIICGVFLSDYVKYVNWMGQIFLRALNMIIIPLVFSSLYNGVTSIGKSGGLGRIAGKTIGFYITTTLIAIFIGLALVNIIRPGIGANISFSESPTDIAATKLTLGEIFLNVIPKNIFAELAAGNLLPIILFAIIFGIFTNFVSEEHQKPLKNLFQSVYEVTIKITLFILKLTPFGIFAIVANLVGNQISDSRSLLDLAGSLGIFILVVWAGCLIQGGIVLPLLTRLIGKENPWRHIRKMSVPLLTAFTTCTSSAALPLSIRDSQANCGISARIAGFTLPLGCTINMNGTALFECVTALFIAQAYGIELTFAQQIIVILTSLVAAVGSAGIPMAGLVMMTIVFNAVGLPLEGIGMVMAVNQICEMPRTFLNSYGDMCGAVIVAKSEGEILTI